MPTTISEATAPMTVRPTDDGEPKEAVVEIAEHRRQHDQDRRGVERAEGGCVHVNSRAGVAAGLMASDDGWRNRPCGCIEIANG